MNKTGTFILTPEKHILGHGCISNANKLKSATKEFVHKAVAVHGNTYGTR